MTYFQAKAITMFIIMLLSVTAVLSAPAISDINVILWSDCHTRLYKPHVTISNTTVCCTGNERSPNPFPGCCREHTVVKSPSASTLCDLGACMWPPLTEKNPTPDPYLLSGGAALGKGDAPVEQPRVGALVLGEGLAHRPAALEHLHLLVLLQRDLQPLLGPQHLLLQRELQFLL